MDLIFAISKYKIAIAPCTDSTWLAGTVDSMQDYVSDPFIDITLKSSAEGATPEEAVKNLVKLLLDRRSYEKS